MASLVVQGATASQAGALPRYAARYEQTCALCHVNPSGGGLRTSYASRKLVPEEIAWKRGALPSLEDLAPDVAGYVRFGTDLREVYLGADVPESHNNFFQMQADLYVAFQPEANATIYLDRGETGNYEMFGLFYPWPAVYVKAGRFVPSYGWRFDDHTMFVRAELGFMPPANSDVGLEAGFARGGFDLQVGVVNGNRGGLLDSDTKVAGVANGVYRRRLGPMGAAVGASAYHQPGEARDLDQFGLYGSVTWSRLTWLGEADRFETRAAGEPMVSGFVASHEVTWLVRQGLEVKGTYDFYDPDRYRESGAKSRWGGGFFVMPRSWATAEVIVRRIDFDSGIAYSGRDYIETVAMLHLLY